MGHVHAGVVLEHLPIQRHGLIHLPGPLREHGDDVAVLVGFERNVEDQGVGMLVADRALQQAGEVADGLGVAPDVRRGQPPVVEHEIRQVIAQADRSSVVVEPRKVVVRRLVVAALHVIETLEEPVIDVGQQLVLLPEDGLAGAGRGLDAKVDERIHDERAAIHPERFIEPGPPLGGHAPVRDLVPQPRPAGIHQAPQGQVAQGKLGFDADRAVQGRVGVVPALFVPVGEGHVVLRRGVVGVLPRAGLELGELRREADVLRRQWRGGAREEQEHDGPAGPHGASS